MRRPGRPARVGPVADRSTNVHGLLSALVAVPLGALALSASPGTADFSRATVPGLIDALQQIDQQTYGLHGTAYIIGFPADGSKPGFGGGVMGSPAPADFGQIQELVRRGPEALGVLLNHVDDPRPTKLVIGAGGFQYMFAWSADEYDPRDPTAGGTKLDTGSHVDLQLPYTVKVGDVCFSIIGEITSRSLRALRYQPTAGLIVNSPVENKGLARRVREDWTGVDAAALRASLVRDATSSETGWAGLPQLKLYFPEEYAKLRSGPLKAKCENYESRLPALGRATDAAPPAQEPDRPRSGAPQHP